MAVQKAKLQDFASKRKIRNPQNIFREAFFYTAWILQWMTIIWAGVTSALITVFWLIYIK